MSSVRQDNPDQQKPCVVIAVTPFTPQWMIKPILWGLEEEGIPSRVSQSEPGEAHELAKKAADSSPLNVGIAVHGDRQTVCLHHRELNARRPLWTLSGSQLQAPTLRLVGMNAARLVKGIPLLFDANQALLDSGDPEGQSQERPWQPPSWNERDEEVIRLIAETIHQLLQDQ